MQCFWRTDAVAALVCRLLLLCVFIAALASQVQAVSLIVFSPHLVPLVLIADSAFCSNKFDSRSQLRALCPPQQLLAERTRSVGVSVFDSRRALSFARAQPKLGNECR